MNFSESILLKFQKKSAVLLETTRATTIISPGIFFSPVMKKPTQPTVTNPLDVSTTTATKVTEDDKKIQHKLFVSVPDYGILKNHGKYVENATFLDTLSPVKEIIPLTPTFNATRKPQGYANEFATQYTAEKLKIAVLTETAVEIYKYRTPDEVFETLIDNPLPFVLNYGLTEACSTALYVTCKFNKPPLLRSNALTFLTVGIPGVIDLKPKYNRYASSTGATTTTITPQKSPSSSSSLKPLSSSNFNLDDVILSPRFYGITLLVARLFRDIWASNVFTLNQHVTVDSSSTTNLTKGSTDSLITGISISKQNVEYYLSSIMVLTEFFATYGDSLTSFATPLLTNRHISDKSDEVANQAENIATNSIIKLAESIKEALSFLNVLYEESEVDGFEGQYLAFNDIIKFLKPEAILKLTKLTFRDLFAPGESTKSLIKDIVLSIINRNISRGCLLYTSRCV